LIKRLRPDALLMFGLAGRTAHLRVETRARNTVTTHLPDADGNRAQQTSIVRGADALVFGPHTANLLQAARATGIDARLSRDAGAYLCNYLSWRAIEATQQPDGPALASFIHVPLIAHDGTARDAASDITLEQLVDAGEAMLMEMVKLTRRALMQDAQY
jgi:pyroglutamyl-peptidase